MRVAVAVLFGQAHGRERYPGQYALADPAISQWFDEQKVPGDGHSCCSLADGTRAEEEIRGEKIFTRFYYFHYVSQLGRAVEDASDWMEVPNEAIIRDGKPNPVGAPVVWYEIKGSQSEIVKIRCYKRANEV